MNTVIIVVSIISLIMLVMLIFLRILDSIKMKAFRKEQENVIIRRKIELERIELRFTNHEINYNEKIKMIREYDEQRLREHFEQMSRMYFEKDLEGRYLTRKANSTFIWTAYRDGILMYFILDLIVNKYINFVDGIRDKEAALTNTEVVTLKYLIRKAYDNAKTCVYGFIAFVVAMLYYFIAPAFNLPTLSHFVLLFLALFILLCYLKQFVFEYRVKRGFYGTCYSEARELALYIIENNKKNGGDAGKPVFLDEEIETRIRKVLNGVIGYGV